MILKAPSLKRADFPRANRLAGLFDKATVVIFAGMGGVCIGVERAYVRGGFRDRYIDLALNHWKVAVGVHELNHPMTQHIQADAREADPDSVLPGRDLGYLHLSPDCFPAGTMVLTIEGYKPIETLRVGDSVFTHLCQWRRVTQTLRSRKSLLSIRTHGHPGLLVSGEHPFYARQRSHRWDNNSRRDVSSLGNPEWVKASDIRCGEYRYQYADGSKAILDGGHFVASPTSFPLSSPPPIGGRGMAADERLMWLAGRYVGDGWTRLTKQRAELVITCGKKEIDSLRKSLGAWPRSGDRAVSGELAWHDRSTRTAHQFTTNHRGLVSWLREHFGHRAESKRIPGWLLGAQRNLREAFLEGYLSADGCTRGKTESCSTVSKALAFGVRDLVSTLGHAASVYLGKKRNVIQGRKVNARQPYEVRWFPNADPKRAQTVHQEWFRWSPVREVVDAGQVQDCFNISVEGDESYVAEGIVTHNCTDFSKAKGDKPKRKHIRALADVGIVWARKRRPDVITLENVEEFEQWGPLTKRGKPHKGKRGHEFDRWIAELRALGYEVDWKCLRACDYGTPTTRKRLFVIARCDGKPIVWPEPTHGKPTCADLLRRDSEDSVLSAMRSEGGRITSSFAASASRASGQEVDRGAGEARKRRTVQPSDSLTKADFGKMDALAGRSCCHQVLKPYRAAAECIDFSLPMLSIFATREQARDWTANQNIGKAKWDRIGVPQRPLKPKTNARMAGGLLKWVLDAEKPFIIQLENSNWGAPVRSIDEPLSTVTATPKGGKHAMVDVETAAFTGTFNHGAGAAHALGLGAVYLSHNYTSNTNGGQGNPEKPHKTVTGGAHHSSVCVVFLAPYYGNEKEGRSVSDPMPTVVSKDRMAFLSATATPHWIFTPAALQRAARVARWARKWLGKKVAKHLMSVTDEAGKQFSLLVLRVKGAMHIITDVVMRMLRPRELARAQGFDDSYVIDRLSDGTRIIKADQVKLIGNSVCPQLAEAIAMANVVELGVMGQMKQRRRVREAVLA